MNRFFYVSIFISLFMNQSFSQDHKLIYVGDPMCSWCYGISENLAAVKEHYKDKLEFEVVLGGLRPYNTETMTDLKNFLTHHWEDVHKASGLPFTYDILDNGQITYDTEPPSRATVIVRSVDAEKAFMFFKEAQKAFYVDNKNMHLATSYHSILDKIGFDKTFFDEAFESPMMKELVKADFARSAKLGVTSFPTLILQVGDKYVVVAKGYATKDQMIATIDKVL